MKALIKRDSIKNILRNNIKFISFSIFLIFLSLLLIVLVNSIQGSVLVKLFHGGYGTVAPLLTIISISLYCIVFIITSKKKVDISKIFLMIAIPIGIAYSVCIPVGLLPDEENHMRRSYEISYGYLFTSVTEDNLVGRELPRELRMIRLSNSNYKALDENTHTYYGEGKEFVEFKNTAAYTFICYLPQVIGIVLARIFGAGILIQAYAGRICNLLCYITIMYFAIKIIPFKKLAVMLIAILPISLQEAGSLAADSITNAICTFFVAYVIYLIYSSDKLNKRDYAILTITSILVALVKIIYLPICALMYLIPSNKFDSKKKKFIVLTVIFVISCVLNLTWLRFVQHNYLQAYNGAIPSKQLEYIFDDPIRYLLICAREFNVHVEYYVRGLLGDNLSNFDVNMSSWFQAPLLLLTILTFVFDENDKIKINWKTKAYFGLIILAIIALLCTSEYISWNPVGHFMVNGIQSRYFIPILLMIAFVCNSRKIKLQGKINYIYIYILLVAIDIHALSYMLNNFMRTDIF